MTHILKSDGNADVNRKPVFFSHLTISVACFTLEHVHIVLTVVKEDEGSFSCQCYHKLVSHAETN